MAKDSNQTIDYDLDVDIDQEFDFEIETESTHKIEVEAEDAYVDVWVDINERVRKDIDIDIDFDEHVVKDIDVNVWTTTVDVWSSNIIEDSWVLYDEDVNDIDMFELLDNDGALAMDDFTVDLTSIGNSFNGPGNDGQINSSQSNELIDNDFVDKTNVSYENWQAPNVHAQVDYSESSNVWARGDFQADWVSHAGKHGVLTNGWAKGWFQYDAAASSSLWANVELSAPTEAFETVVADGGRATAGDGIGWANLDDTNNDNEGDGAVSGAADASANAKAEAESFTSEILAGGNTQANIWSLDVVGGNVLDAGDISHSFNTQGNGNGYSANSASNGNGGDEADGLAIKNSDVVFDNDLNDIDLEDLIDNDGALTMDDFDLDIDAIANSFNGAGNDYAFDNNQTNDLIDNDVVTNTNVSYAGDGWNGPFQDVAAYGGTSTAGDGIGDISTWNTGNGNGGSGSIAGSTAASADALATAQAFTSNIVVGANVQVNNLATSVVGGDSSAIDDIDNSFNG